MPNRTLIHLTYFAQHALVTDAHATGSFIVIVRISCIRCGLIISKYFQSAQKFITRRENLHPNTCVFSTVTDESGEVLVPNHADELVDYSTDVDRQR